jgi:hypothetical protein
MDLVRRLHAARVWRTGIGGVVLVNAIVLGAIAGTSKD